MKQGIAQIIDQKADSLRAQGQNPQAVAQQSMQQGQLMDALAAQKVLHEKKKAQEAMAAASQGQPGTVVEQNDNALKQMSMQEMAQQVGGLARQQMARQQQAMQQMGKPPGAPQAAPQAAPQQMAPQGAGIGKLPASNMAPKMMAAGGIVSFAGGGMPEPSHEQMYRTEQDLVRAIQQAPDEATRQQLIQQLMQMRKSQGSVSKELKPFAQGGQVQRFNGTEGSGPIDVTDVERQKKYKDMDINQLRLARAQASGWEKEQLSKELEARISASRMTGIFERDDMNELERKVALARSMGVKEINPKRVKQAREFAETKTGGKESLSPELREAVENAQRNDRQLPPQAYGTQPGTMGGVGMAPDANDAVLRSGATPNPKTTVGPDTMGDVALPSDQPAAPQGNGAATATATTGGIGALPAAPFNPATAAQAAMPAEVPNAELANKKLAENINIDRFAEAKRLGDETKAINAPNEKDEAESRAQYAKQKEYFEYDADPKRLRREELTRMLLGAANRSTPGSVFAGMTAANINAENNSRRRRNAGLAGLQSRLDNFRSEDAARKTKQSEAYSKGYDKGAELQGNALGEVAAAQRQGQSDTAAAQRVNAQLENEISKANMNAEIQQARNDLLAEKNRIDATHNAALRDDADIGVLVDLATKYRTVIQASRKVMQESIDALADSNAFIGLSPEEKAKNMAKAEMKLMQNFFGPEYEQMLAVIKKAETMTVGKVGNDTKPVDTTGYSIEE